MITDLLRQIAVDINNDNEDSENENANVTPQSQNTPQIDYAHSVGSNENGNGVRPKRPLSLQSSQNGGSVQGTQR